MIDLVVCSQVAKVKPYCHFAPTNLTELRNNIQGTITNQESSLLLIDLERIDSLDSGTLMVLVSAFSLAQSLGRRLILCSVAPAIKIILELSQLDQILEIFDSQAAFEAAIA